MTASTDLTATAVDPQAAVAVDGAPRVLLRRLVPADRPAVQRLVEQARPGETWGTAADELRRPPEHDRLELVAVDRGEPDRVIGTGLATRPEARSRSHQGGVALAVAPEERRRGVGRLLGSRLLDWHRERGAAGVHVEVAASDLPTLRLWDGLGLSTVGRVPDGVRTADGSLVDLLQLHLDLRRPAPAGSPSSPGSSSGSVRSGSAGQRERLVSAAASSFRERGYTGTLLEDLAVELELDLDVVHRLAGSKAELLWAAAEWTTALPAYRSLAEALASLDLHEVAGVDERLDRLVELLCGVHERLGPLVAALNEGAALDPAALAMRQGSDLRRLSVSRAVVHWLCRGETPEPDAADMVHVLMMSETYLTFVRNGWTTPRYARWLRETLDRSVNGARARG